MSLITLARLKKGEKKMDVFAAGAAERKKDGAKKKTKNSL